MSDPDYSAERTNQTVALLPVSAIEYDQYGHIASVRFNEGVTFPVMQSVSKWVAAWNLNIRTQPEGGMSLADRSRALDFVGGAR